MAETTTITGIVQAIKGDGKGLAIKGDNPKGDWYSNKFFKGNIDAKKGDEVELTIAINGQYKNLMAVKVIKANTNPNNSQTDYKRENVDAGNCLQRATELIIAGKTETNNLVVETKRCVAAFKGALRELASTPEPLEKPKNDQGLDEDGEY